MVAAIPPPSGDELVALKETVANNKGQLSVLIGGLSVVLAGLGAALARLFWGQSELHDKIDQSGQQVRNEAHSADGDIWEIVKENQNKAEAFRERALEEFGKMVTRDDLHREVTRLETGIGRVENAVFNLTKHVSNGKTSHD